MNHSLSARWLANPNCVCSHLPHNFLELIRFSSSLSKWRFSMLIKWSISLPSHVDYWPIMISRSWARSPISFKHVPFWCQFFDPHLTTNYSNIGIHIIVVMDLEMSYLMSPNTSLKFESKLLSRFSEVLKRGYTTPFKNCWVQQYSTITYSG